MFYFSGATGGCCCTAVTWATLCHVSAGMHSTRSYRCSARSPDSGQEHVSTASTSSLSSTPIPLLDRVNAPIRVGGCTAAARAARATSDSCYDVSGMELMVGMMPIGCCCTRGMGSWGLDQLWLRGRFTMIRDSTDRGSWS